MAGKKLCNRFAAWVAASKSQKPLDDLLLVLRFVSAFGAGGGSPGHLSRVRRVAISEYFSGFELSFLEFPNQVFTSAAVIVRRSSAREASNAVTTINYVHVQAAALRRCLG
jgi:hypothetical protein